MPERWEEVNLEREWAAASAERVRAAFDKLPGEAKAALRTALEESVTDPHARGQVFEVLNRLGL